ncbi:DUF2235 domain-containing protein [Propionivibrio soli]|uniref:DUF2235 domain-containing protein n=1 Tax=Propionivibrio soli TaxID=2976531 RepID=UPI0021E7DEEA|nr:DUF2235 domain-containing protein [Propionivibrio soli]
MTTETPAKAPYPVDAFLKFSAEDQSRSGLALCDQATTLPCRVPVHVGLFFDGTNNNMERDRNGRRIGLPDAHGKITPLPNRPMKAEQCGHSNVARLYNAFPADKQSCGYYRYYIPGVGTEFKEIGEPAESADGKAFAKGGQPRIMWGILQVLNAIHMTVFEQRLLYEDDQAGQLVRDYDKEANRAQQDTYGHHKFVTHKMWFEEHLDLLKALLSKKPKPEIPSLRLSVFGFSRGGAEAAAFCHFFNDLLEDGKLVGIPTDICFLGLFDVVATVGTSDSIRKTMIGPDALYDGHCSWANRILKPLPSCVVAGKHFISAHEVRMNFPVTTMQGAVEEVYFPGVHSDVGGGYAPGEQGKGCGSQAALLSQIPLAHMYKAARLAGVPLTPFSELEARDKVDFEVAPALASAWEAYTAALDGKGHLLKRHMSLYYRWRAARLNTLTTASNFVVANAQDRQDMDDANRMLAGDLVALRKRREGRPLDSSRDDDGRGPQLPFKLSDLERINRWHFMRAQRYTPLDEWEEWALKIFDKPEPLPAEVMRFFDDYVHDSFAGFYMAGEVTEYDKRAKVAKVMRKDPNHLEGFDKKVYEITAKTKTAQDKKAAGEALTPEEEALVEEAKYGTPYPVMTDKDSADMRNWVITFQTETRREGGGYIIRRSYYPESGFFWRKYIREEELQRVAAAHYIWSNDLRQDIPAAKRADAHYAEAA